MVTQQHFCTSLNIPHFFWISGAEQHSNTAFQCHSHTSYHCISLFIAVTVLVTRTTKVHTWTSTEGQNWWKAERCSNTLAVCVIKHHCQRVVHLQGLTGHSIQKQGDKPSHATHLDLLCICDHRVVAVTLATVLGHWHPHSTNPTAPWQSCCFPSLQRTTTYLQLSKRTALWVLCESINKY